MLCCYRALMTIENLAISNEIRHIEHRQQIDDGDGVFRCSLSSSFSNDLNRPSSSSFALSSDSSVHDNDDEFISDNGHHNKITHPLKECWIITDDECKSILLFLSMCILLFRKSILCVYICIQTTW